MSDKAERIVSAALLVDGFVLTAPHHHQILRYAVPLVGRWAVSGQQGFLTSENRFVTREVAASIAYRAKQIVREQDSLFSEQLWEVPDRVFVGLGPSRGGEE